MPLYLEENEDVVVPPPGKRVLFLGIIDKALKTLDSQGVVSDLGAPLDWWAQRQRRAEYVLNRNSIQVDSPKRFDYVTSLPALAGTNPPTQSAALSGRVYEWLAIPGHLNDMSPAGSKFIANPATESWYCARLVSFNSATIDGSNAIPLNITATAGGAGTSYIQITQNAGLSATGSYLSFNSGAGATTTQLPTTCSLGGDLCPIFTPITIAIYFDLRAGQLVVEFQDTEVLRVSAAGGGLAQMPTVPLLMEAYCNNVNLLLRCYGGFAMVKGATT